MLTKEKMKEWMKNGRISTLEHPKRPESLGRGRVNRLALRLSTKEVITLFEHLDPVIAQIGNEEAVIRADYKHTGGVELAVSCSL